MVRLVKYGLKECEFENISNNDKNLSEIQLDHERVDRLVVVVVKVVHEVVVKEIENGLVEEMEKLEWWFEQDINDERDEVEEDEEDKDGGEVRELSDLNNGKEIIERQSMVWIEEDAKDGFAKQESHSSTNDGNTDNVHVSTGSTPVSTNDAIVYAYLATQPNGSQVVHEDLDQIH
ncbi:hypothetical protein Tco_1433853, partial [Tanacetum coccineum]